MTRLILKVTLVVALAMVSLGCTSLFIAENKPKTVKEKSNPQSVEMDNISINNIKEFENVTQGIISDISSNGNKIILLKQDAQNENSTNIGEFNTISTYDLKNQSITHILSPKVKITMGRFDKDEKGVFYLENTSESIFHLYWIDHSGEKKLRVSSKDHQVNPNYYILPNDEVYYGTKDGKIIHANKNRILSTIDVGTEYYIQQIYFYRDDKLILFSANKNGDLNLYSIKPNGEDLTLIIPKILGNFDVTKKEDKLTYLTPITDSNKKTLWLFDLEKLENKNLLEGYPSMQSFSPKGNKVAYIDKSESNSDLHNIWVLDLKTNENIQVASNLKLNSQIFWHPRQNRLYFSTYERLDNGIEATLHSLNFEE